MRDETILCISTAAWNALWMVIHQIMSRIARRNRVLFFEPGRNPERAVLGEFWRNLPRFFEINTDFVNERLIRIPTPSVLPYARQHLPRPLLRITVPLVAKLNSEILVRHVRRVLEKIRVKEPILWIHDPRYFHLVGHCGEKLACYFNYDEFPNFIHNTRIKELMRDYDDLLTRRSDIIFTTGTAQWESRKRINPNTHLIPNGVDFELFHKALDPETEIPVDIKKLRKPIIGYAGSLKFQIDVPLLLKVADAYSHCSIVLVGPNEIPRTVDLMQLRSKPNVFFAGRKDLDALPGCLKAFDVALIPYLLEGYTLTAYPLKLHEYLAAGRAIVSSALPELSPFARMIRIARNHDEFIEQIDEAMKSNSPNDIEARVAVARNNTWDSRVADIYRIVENALAQPSGK